MVIILLIFAYLHMFALDKLLMGLVQPPPESCRYCRTELVKCFEGLARVSVACIHLAHDVSKSKINYTKKCLTLEVF